MSVINYAETLTKLVEWGSPLALAQSSLSDMKITIAPCIDVHAVHAAALYLQARQFGLSMGDRFCLALAVAMNLPVLTADNVWHALDLGITIRFIR